MKGLLHEGEKASVFCTEDARRYFRSSRVDEDRRLKNFKSCNTTKSLHTFVEHAVQHAKPNETSKQRFDYALSSLCGCASPVGSEVGPQTDQGPTRQDLRDQLLVQFMISSET